MNNARTTNDGLLSRMRRYPERGWVAGVCAGIAEYFDWNLKLIRVLMILALIFSGFFPVGVIYIVLWYLMDKADDNDPPTRYGAPDPAPRTTPGAARERFEKLEKRLQRMEACVSQEDLELRRQFRKLES